MPSLEVAEILTQSHELRYRAAGLLSQSIIAPNKDIRAMAVFGAILGVLPVQMVRQINDNEATGQAIIAIIYASLEREH